MDFSHVLFVYFDSLIIWFYRIVEIPIFGYFFGTAFLAFLCVISGQFTLSISWLINRKFLDQDNRNMIHMHNLSIKALFVKDKTAYTACNRQANDAFGKYFFSQIALGISSLWPVPFALGWMQTRFARVEFLLPVNLPYIGDSVGYTFTFIPVYMLVYILFGKIKNKLPYFRKIKNMLDSQEKDAEQMISLADLADNQKIKTSGHAA
jgi:hypothetical protein